MPTKKFIILIVFLIVLSFLLGIFTDKFALTGSVVSEDPIESTYTWTKAICNEEKRCIDVLIECENGVVSSIEPVSDLIQQNEGWKDIRDNIDEFCK